MHLISPEELASTIADRLARQPERKLSVVFEGEFTGSDRIIYLQNERNPVDFIDYSKGKPVVRKLKAPTTGSGVQTNTLQVRSPAQ